MSSPPRQRNRRVRYGAPIGLIIAAVLFAAVDVDQVGNDVQLVGTAVGLIWLIVVVGRDMGMGVSTGRRPHVPDPPPGDGRDGGRPRGERR